MIPRRGCSARVLLVVLAVLGLLPASAVAHGLRPGALTLEERAPDVFAVVWTEPVDTRGAATPVEVSLPRGCRHTADTLDCTDSGLRGTIEFPGLAEQGGRVVVFVQFLRGEPLEAFVDADDPRLVLDRAPGDSASAWMRLGITHVLGGLDHLAFILGLLLVVGVSDLRRLVATITAFTLAHSTTLALAATGVVALRPAPVEAAIAASVLLVAREAWVLRPSLTRRAPWVVALVFGLVHGLGFAGALASWGMTAGWNLLWFNVGVEAGQLAVVLIVFVGAPRLGRRLDAWRRPVVYAIGGLAGWWFIERTLELLTAAP